MLFRPTEALMGHYWVHPMAPLKEHSMAPATAGLLDFRTEARMGHYWVHPMASLKEHSTAPDLQSSSGHWMEFQTETLTAPPTDVKKETSMVIHLQSASGHSMGPPKARLMVNAIGIVVCCRAIGAFRSSLRMT